MFKKTTLSAAIILSLSTGAAQAAKFNITFMDFPGMQNPDVVGTVDTGAGTGKFTSGGTPFFGHAWTATVAAGFESSGPGSWNFNTASGAESTGTYNFTLAPGQVAMGVLLDWNGNVGIPVLNILNADGSGVDIDGDGTLGTQIIASAITSAPMGFAGTTIVPVPAAAWLMGSGLIGLAGFARRRQNR